MVFGLNVLALEALGVHFASALWCSTDLDGLRTAVSGLPYSFDILF